MRFRYTILLLSSLAVCYCQTNLLSPVEYVAFIRASENGFIQTESLTNFTVEAFYQPALYVALMQSSPEGIKEEPLNASTRRFENFYQFLVSIRCSTNSPIDEQLGKLCISKDSFQIKKEIMLYRLQNYFTLVQGADSLACTFYHAQPSGKVDNAYHFMVVFETNDKLRYSDKKEVDLKLMYKDPLWFQRDFTFVFSHNTIQNAPKIKL